MTLSKTPALTPHGKGHQFVCYADSCSGVKGALHEKTFAQVNKIVASLEPPPEFICFPGDEIQGLVSSELELRNQWRYWFEHEMAWLDRATALYQTTGNHTTYDTMSERVFADVMSHLPNNGPETQKGLSYFIRKDDLLMVFIHTLWSGLGGEGFVETDWLEQTLSAHKDARYKMVFGHHPVFPVNGFAGEYQRHLGSESASAFWQCLIRHHVLAYWCSHILAFDVQVHDGVLHLCTAGAGTAHRMPEESEYLHCVQASLDTRGLRYQVLDAEAKCREWLEWPPKLPEETLWSEVDPKALPMFSAQPFLLAFNFEGVAPDAPHKTPQTFLSLVAEGSSVLWIGLQAHRLCVLISPAPGRSPHLWYGPHLEPEKPFNVQVLIHPGMGPGGILWRWHEDISWSSLQAASSWGAERLSGGDMWHLGYGASPTDRPFLGRDLRIHFHSTNLKPLFSQK